MLLHSPLGRYIFLSSSHNSMQANSVGPDGFATSIALSPAGVLATKHGQGDAVCIVVMSGPEDLSGRFNLRQTLSSLQRLHHKNWQTFVAVQDEDEASHAALVAVLQDTRFKVSTSKHAQKNPRSMAYSDSFIVSSI